MIVYDGGFFNPQSYAISVSPFAPKWPIFEYYILYLMPSIILSTLITAPIEVCFDLSRSIDLHQVSTARTGERAIAGRTRGLINQGETVTWRARHLGVWQSLTSRITDMARPFSFSDEMLRGAFHSFRHDHTFKETPAGTLMEDHFSFKSPLGFLGLIADVLFLRAYMTRLLEERNRVIKEYAESGKWRNILT
jgi:ligand-binding SRPBCC domain-containing protein